MCRGQRGSLPAHSGEGTKGGLYLAGKGIGLGKKGRQEERGLLGEVRHDDRERESCSGIPPEIAAREILRWKRPDDTKSPF